MAMTRRQLLMGLLLGGAWGGAGLLAACGQPNPTPGRAAAAGTPVGTATVGSLPLPSAPGTPGNLPIPTAMPTALGTVVLPTAPTDPYPRSDIRTPEVLPAPLPYSTPRPSDPYRIEIASARDGNPRLSTELNTLVVVATVMEIRPAQWSTPDGRRPANPHDRQSPYGIYTPMFVQVEQVAKGAAPLARLAVVIPGGTVGDDYIRYSDGLYDFEVDQRVVLFLKLRDLPAAN